jgi:tetratricopeptide (TPR) repeat protein
MKHKASCLIFAYIVLFMIVPGRGFSFSSSKQADPFYQKLLEEGKWLWSRGSIAEAVENLEIAYFGFLKNPRPLLESAVYLMVCHFEAGNKDRAAFFEARLSELGAGDRLAGLGLPPALLEKYHEICAYFERQRMAGQSAPPSIEDKSPLMNSEAVAPPQKSPFSRIAELEQFIEQDRNAFSAYLEIASLYMEYGNAKMAKPVLERLLELDPANAAGRFALGKAYMALEDNREAASEFEKALPALDGDIELHYQKGIAHYKIRDFGEAGKEFERVRSMSAGYKLSTEYLEEIARLTGPEPLAEAEPEPEKPSAGQPETQPEPPAEPDYVEMARKEGRLKEKIRYYTEALKQDASQIDIYFEMADAYGAEKKYRQEAGLLEYLIEYLPHDLRIHTRLAELYVFSKSYDDAVAICREGLEIDRQNLDLGYFAGRAYMGKKQWADAAVEFRRILDKSPDFRDARSLLETCLRKIKR